MYEPPRFASDYVIAKEIDCICGNKIILDGYRVICNKCGREYQGTSKNGNYIQTKRPPNYPEKPDS